MSLRARAVERFARAVARRPGRALLLALALAGVGAALTTTLELQSSYTALLPEGATVVRELQQARRLAGGSAELVIAIGGEDEKQRLDFGRRLAKRLQRSPAVQWAQAELPSEFFSERRLWLLPAGDLRKLRDGVATAVRQQKARANPLYVDLEDDEDEADRAQDPLAGLRALEREHAGDAAPPRTLTSRDGRYLFVVVKPLASAAEIAEGRQTLAAIQRTVEQTRGPADTMPVRYAGSLLANQLENARMSRDLSLASVIALVLGVALITLLTRRLSATLVVGVPLCAGLLVTLGAATLMVGHLNLVSGFLVAALVGLGIDFGIHLYLRFLDELRCAPVSSFDEQKRAAMERAISATLGACLTSALTTAVAFLALVASSFRGFSEFGLIAGVGVLLTLGVTFLLLPPAAIYLTRRPPGRGARRPDRARPLARPVAWAMLACGLGFVLLSGARLGELRFHNNFRHLKGEAPELAFTEYVERELGGSLSPAVIMVDGLQHARTLERLAARRAEQQRRSQGSPVVGRTLSLASMVPTDVAQKRPLLADLARQLRDLLAKNQVQGEDAKKLRRLLALAGTRPWTEEQVPEAFRRRLVAVDGSKHFVLAWPAGQLYEDRQILRWAGELEALSGALAQAGVSTLVLDENRIAARVLALIRAEGPRVLLLSAIAVLLVLLLDFRRLDRVALVGCSVACGLVAMMGVMVLFDLSLNLFNVVVLPSVLGIGIDNAVHIQHAYNRSGPGSVPRVVATTGRAALLASVTTAVGFGAAIIAHHAGVRQMGILALVGIGCTFVASTVLFPALLRVLERRAAAAPVSAPGAPAPVTAPQRTARP